MLNLYIFFFNRRKGQTKRPHSDNSIMPGTDKYGRAECHLRLPTQHSKVTLKVSFLKFQYVFIYLRMIPAIVKVYFAILSAFISSEIIIENTRINNI